MNAKIAPVMIFILMIICSFQASSINLDMKLNNNYITETSELLSICNNNNFEYGLGENSSDFSPDGAGETLSGETPSSFDWRNAFLNESTGYGEPGNKSGYDWTTAIKNQGACGSCYAFAPIGVLECLYKIKEKKNSNTYIDLSEQFILSCGSNCYPYDIKGCRGGRLEASQNFIKNYGAINESCFSYIADDSNCDEKCEDWKDYRVFIDSANKLSRDKETLKNALIQYGPLPTKMTVYEDLHGSNQNIPHYPNEDEWQEDVYYHKYGDIAGGGCTDIQNHDVIIVGYKDDSNVSSGGYWICKNSWSENWGIPNPYDEDSQGGWFKIKYNNCFIEYDTYYLDGIRIEEKSIESKLTLSEEELSLGYIKPDKKICLNFYVTNIGHPGSKLNWGINPIPAQSLGWRRSIKDGNGNDFSYNSTDGLRDPPFKLTPEYGTFLVNYSFETNGNNNEKFEGKLVFIDKDKEECLECNKKSIKIDFIIKENVAPETPEISGPSGDIGLGTYKYTFRSSDENGDFEKVYYRYIVKEKFSMSPEPSSWFGPFVPGEESDSVDITFNKKGNYIIKAQAKDEDGATSDWGKIERPVPKSSNAFFKYLIIIKRLIDIFKNI